MDEIAAGDAGVVDQDVQATVRLQRCFEDPPHIRSLGDICLNDGHSPAVFLDQPGSFLERFFSPPADDHTHTPLRQSQRNALADATAPTSHNRDFTGKFDFCFHYGFS